jgi:hypothetical protein
MARNDGRIEPGQKLAGAISAKAWNRAQDAADRVLGAGTGFAAGGSQDGSAPYTFVYAKNATGGTVARWGIMSITGVEITPTSTSGGATAQFEQMPVITGGTPSATTTAWCVAVEPIESNKIGRVAVAGVVQCKVADLGKASGAHVLWKNSDWALVRINAGLVRGTFSGTWSKGSTTTVTDAVLSGATYTAKNYLATISGSTCLITYVAEEWVLIGWDWHALAGYSAGSQQVLAHAANGGLSWINTTACT